MESKDSSSGQNIILKCKPFTVLSAVPPHSSPNATTTRRSNRISTSSRANENEMEENQKKALDGKRSIGKRKQVNRRHCPTDTDDEDNFVVTKKKSPTKRRSQNRIQSSDDDFVTSKPKKTPKKSQKRGRDNVQTKDEGAVEPTQKSPVKKRKPIPSQNNKITAYFGKTTKAIGNEEAEKTQISDPVTRTDVIPIAPSDVIVLSSSEEDDDVTEPSRPSVTIENVIPPPIPLVPLTRQQTNKPKYPHYKVVDGTNFAVDAFRFGEIAGVTTYFLTHFHSDHYVGLNENFNRPIYMSTITGRLVKAILKVNAKLIRTMDINTKYIIDGVEVTAIDANHCPGAVMFIFKLQNGQTILHTGDFRATPEMESNPVFWNNNFASIYLDTTYLHKSYNFFTQNDALLFVEDEVRKFKEKNIGTKHLIVVGSYVIGKERVWSHIAQTFKMKVWLEDERRKAFELIYSDENVNHVVKDRICDAREDAQLHVIPIQCLNYSFLMNYLENFEDHNLLAFRPTGWAKNAKPQYGSRVSIVGVQYSEHSSYSELERFVRFVQPEKVISTVPISSGNPNTKNVPNNWLTTTTKPMTSSQRTVTSFMKVRKSSSSLIADKSSDRTQSNRPSSTSQQLVRDDAASYDSVETDFMP